MFTRKNKVKNDVSKKPEKPDQKGCLAQYLAIHIIGTCCFALFSFSTITSALRDYPEYFESIQHQLIAFVVITVVIFICSIGLIRWKHWAYYGTLIGTGFLILVTMLNPYTAGYGVMCFLWIIPLVVMIHPKRHILD